MHLRGGVEAAGGSVFCAAAGQSGSPAWELRSDGSRYIKAVVSHQACSGTVSGTYPGQTCSSGYNGFVQFDSTHYNNILNWR